MGCDIHPYVERKINDEWHMWADLRCGPSFDDWGWGGQRDYAFFAQLCGVRANWNIENDMPEPKGLPDDVSEVVKLRAQQWDCDGHSHSWETLDDFVDKKLTLIKLRNEDKDVSAASKEYFFYKIVGFELSANDDPDDFRVVFWFDN